MGYVRWVIIVLLANQASIAGVIAGERMILREPDAVIGQKHAGGHATKDARAGPVTLLDRVAAAVDGAESSHGKDIAMWRPDPSGPQGPMQVGEAAATDVGGGDRFDLSQNRAIGRAYLALLYGRYKNWPDAITAYNWGLSNVDTWIKVGRPPEKLLAPVAAYTTRVLYHSGLCYSTQIIQRRRSANFKGEPGFRAAIADPLNQTVLVNSDTAGGTSTGNERYPCATVPSSSKPGPSRLNQDATPSQSLLDQITASARRSWKVATRRPRM
jgi:transglycosylase-like protein with SLT domain